MAKPPFSNNKFQLEGMRDAAGQLMDLKVGAWINPSKDDRFDEEKKKLCEHITQLIIDNNLGMRLKVEHRDGADYTAWPVLGHFNLFANKPFDQNNPPAPAAVAPQPAPLQPATAAPTPVPAPTGGFGGNNG
ncbi:MAG: hypothetical protein ACPGF7_10735 [Pontibacterium sp.]